jgi:hypothetical protein
MYVKRIEYECLKVKFQKVLQLCFKLNFVSVEIEFEKVTHEKLIVRVKLMIVENEKLVLGTWLKGTRILFSKHRKSHVLHTTSHTILFCVILANYLCSVKLEC